MNEIRDRLLHKFELLSGILPDRQVVETVSERVAEWLTSSDAEPTCSVRVKGILVIASKEDSMLLLTVWQPSVQVNDSTSPGFEHRGGPSLLEPGSTAKVVKIPLSEISEEG